MHQLAVIISLALVVDSNSIVRSHCSSPGIDLELLEQVLCVSESIRMRAEQLAEGEVAPYTERRLALKADSAQKPRKGEEILRMAMERVREAAKLLEKFERGSRKGPKQ
jgi:hypothetical protein